MMEQQVIDAIVNEIYNRLKQCDHASYLLLIGAIGVEDEKMLKGSYQLTRNTLENLDHTTILISELSEEQLAHLALGCSYTDEERCILKALLEGRTVYLLESGITYRKYKKTAHKPLYTLYQDYESKLIQYGIRIISHIGELFTSQKEEPILTHSKEVDLKHKKLLLETDLIHTHLETFTVIEISKKCIVTPLAEDYIRSHKLKIKRV